MFEAAGYAQTTAQRLETKERTSFTAKGREVTILNTVRQSKCNSASNDKKSYQIKEFENEKEGNMENWK